MIEISCINNNFYIWNVDDVDCVRKEFRIIGTLVGCLPRLPKQNVHLGLPLQLSILEARLLVEIGVAGVYNDSNLTNKPSDAEVLAFKQQREQSYAEQLEACKTEKQKVMTQNLEQIVLGKKLKIESVEADEGQSKKRKKKKMRQLLNSQQHCSDSADDDLRDEIQQQIESLSVPASLPEKAVCIQIHTASSRPAQLPECSSECSFDLTKMTSQESLRYRVFRHFWEKGFYLTAGGKFGGDFLIYPGDPARYHSFYIAVCIECSRQLPAVEIVRLGRLGNSVKKTILLCSVDADDKVNCLSLLWTGIT